MDNLCISGNVKVVPVSLLVCKCSQPNIWQRVVSFSALDQGYNSSAANKSLKSDKNTQTNTNTASNLDNFIMPPLKVVNSPKST